MWYFYKALFYIVYILGFPILVLGNWAEEYATWRNMSDTPGDSVFEKIEWFIFVLISFPWLFVCYGLLHPLDNLAHKAEKK
jgi:hypothetical protein